MADIKIKDYLTFEEMKTIVDALANEPDVAIRVMLTDIYLLKFGTDIDIPEEISSEVYDQYIMDGTINKIRKQIKNLDTLEEMINKTFSVENIIYRFASTFIGQFGEAIKNLPMDKIKEMINENQDAEIVIKDDENDR